MPETGLRQLPGARPAVTFSQGGCCSPHEQNKELMKTKILSLAAALALGGGLTRSALGADAEVKVQIDPPRAEAQAGADAAVSPGSDRPETRNHGVKPTNKASSIIGMEVRNRNNEKLGEIKDLVLDLPSGRISYAVLSVGGFLGIGEKLLAIPTSALSTTEDPHKLLLNADRAKIEGTPGFAATNWPEVRNPKWGGETLWNTDNSERLDDKSARPPRTDETPAAQPRSSADKVDPLYTDADPARNPGKTAPTTLPDPGTK